MIKENIELIEKIYLELLDVLNFHVANGLCILSVRPSIGNFGLFAPLVNTTA